MGTRNFSKQLRKASATFRVNMIDPIADMLTRIRNASLVGKNEVVLPMSKIKLNIAKILEKEGWIAGSEVVKTEGRKNKAAGFDELKISLKYRKDGRPAMTSLKRISKPGLKIYITKDEIPRVLNNFGMAIISTSRGLMTDKEARKSGVGGELICEIY